jgi:hypothetical protein
MLWLCASLALAGPVEAGAEAFEAGRLDDAIAAWESGLDGPRSSGVLLFDLGNAWYRKGDLPRAIAHYRAAQQRRPRDGDVHHNLALARSELGSVPPPVASASAWTSVVTPGELGVLGMVLVALGSGLLVASRLRGRPERVPGVLALAGGMVVLGLSVAGTRAAEQHPVAVVVDGEAVVRDAASVAAGERHRLRPGTEVRVERRYAGFLLVEDGLERRGWIAEGAALVR